MMDALGAMLFVILFMLAGVVFIYCYHMLMDKAMRYNHDAWKHAIHAQDDAWQRMNSERLTSAKQIEVLMQWNASLTQQAVESGRREIDEARRFMTATKHELLAEVVKQVRYNVMNILMAQNKLQPGSALEPERDRSGEDTQKLPKGGGASGV